jgi:hypothetical protein
MGGALSNQNPATTELGIHFKKIKGILEGGFNAGFALQDHQ